SYNDDWLDSFTFMENVTEINVSLDFPFEISFNEGPTEGVLPVSEESDVSEITTDSSPIVDGLPTSSSAASDIVDQGQKQQVVSTKRKKGPVSKYRLSKSKSKVPNVSRGKPAVLYAFPSFDKCDSLLYFPTSMSRLSNSGDLAGLTKLIKTHFHKRCITEMEGAQLDLAGTLKLFEVYDMLCPDSMECVTQTKVIENCIEATLVAKYTESNFLYQMVEQKVKGTPFQAMLRGSRSAFLRSAKFADEAVQEQFRASDLPDSGLDFTVHASLHFKLTFDDMHRKVTKMEFAMIMNSMEPIS
ncbi:MAG: hypothetical protein WBJ81_01485, partial [Rickettsiales bacterium]